MGELALVYARVAPPLGVYDAVWPPLAVAAPVSKAGRS